MRTAVQIKKKYEFPLTILQAKTLEFAEKACGGARGSEREQECILRHKLAFMVPFLLLSTAARDLHGEIITQRGNTELTMREKLGLFHSYEWGKLIRYQMQQQELWVSSQRRYNLRSNQAPANPFSDRVQEQVKHLLFTHQSVGKAKMKVLPEEAPAPAGVDTVRVLQSKHRERVSEIEELMPEELSSIPYPVFPPHVVKNQALKLKRGTAPGIDGARTDHMVAMCSAKGLLLEATRWCPR